MTRHQEWRGGGVRNFAPEKSCHREMLESPVNTTKIVSYEVGESHKVGMGVLDDFIE